MSKKKRLHSAITRMFNRPGCILVAEDQRMNIESYKIVFQSMELSNCVIYYTNGLELIKKVKAELKKDHSTDMPIPLLLLDYQMPELNGIEVIKEVRRLYAEVNRSKPIPLIEPKYVMLSAHIGLLLHEKDLWRLGVKYLE